jgi:hypothetical protein
MKEKYPQVHGLSTVLKMMLEHDENARVDFLELKQIVNANNYLELKHVIISL